MENNRIFGPKKWILRFWAFLGVVRGVELEYVIDYNSIFGGRFWEVITTLLGGEIERGCTKICTKIVPKRAQKCPKMDELWKLSFLPF
jgi:hypothetical protein